MERPQDTQSLTVDTSRSPAWSFGTRPTLSRLSMCAWRTNVPRRGLEIPMLAWTESPCDSPFRRTIWRELQEPRGLFSDGSLNVVWWKVPANDALERPAGHLLRGSFDFSRLLSLLGCGAA